jgi:hypothetical protein
MKNVIIPCAVVALIGFASLASAAEPVAKSTLSSMGFGGMQQMSDETGMTIRGKGTFANVWGQSGANFRGQTSANNYEAGASWHGKSSFAQGSSMSFAGKIQVNYAADPTGSALSASVIGGIAGGGAKAYAR